MPSFTVRGLDLRGVGPVVAVRAGVGSSLEAELAKAGNKIPTPLPARALVDTGAARTAIRQGLAQELGLSPVGVIRIRAAGSAPIACMEFFLRLGLPSNLIWEGEALELPLRGAEIDCLIGRDPLARGVLLYDGPRNQFTLTF